MGQSDLAQGILGVCSWVELNLLAFVLNMSVIGDCKRGEKQGSLRLLKEEKTWFGLLEIRK